MKKALMLASVASMIEQFNMDNIALLKELGYKVDIIANFEYGSTMPQNKVDTFKADLKNNDIAPIQVAIPRKIFDIKGIIKSYTDIKRAIKENKYEIIHCHSPIGGVVARLAAIGARKKFGTRVIYTAHGFHFFKGSPLISWILYFPLEWFCSFFTDILITINKEDYSLAKKHMHAKKVVYVPGVGINTEKIENTCVDKTEKRKELEISDKDIVVISVGELNDNKNHETIVRAIAKLNRSDITYVICGEGARADFLKNLAKELNIKLMLLGYRNDVTEILKACNIFAFPSKREGLGLAAIEAMSAGIPIVGSNIHGILDYLVDGETGYGCKPTDVDAFSEKIEMLIENEALRKKIGKNNIEEARKFDIKNISDKMKKIYIM